jgi:hypothetical protein
VHALGHRAAKPEAIQAILAAMNDPDERVRTAAVYSLLNIEPNPFRHRSQAQQLSNQGLQTAIWALKRWAQDPDVSQQKKTAIPPLLETLMAEQRARWHLKGLLVVEGCQVLCTATHPQAATWTQQTVPTRLDDLMAASFQ